MMSREERIIRFQKKLKEMDLDAFLVAVPENRYYLSGFEPMDLALTESSGYLLISPERRLILTDFRYRELARKQAPDFELVEYTQGFERVLPDLLHDLRIHRLGVEAHYLTYRKYRQVEVCLHKVCEYGKIIAVEDMVEQLRLRKDPDEIAMIRASLAITEEVMNEVWQFIASGVREKDVAWEIEKKIREKGAETVAFPPIVASGPNAALPHAVPSERRIGEGEPVIIDIGARLNLYCSDMTRTWFSGKPEPRLREIFRIVRQAQLAAQEEIRAGVDSYEVDQVARRIIDDAGYGECFGHGLGHGVGLAVHEGPALNKKDHIILESGMIVTVEPGIYIAGYGGVRLENMVLVTADGYEVLNETELFYES